LEAGYFDINDVPTTVLPPQNLYYAVTFFFQVDGFDKDGFPLKRISPTAVTGQSPGKDCLSCIAVSWYNTEMRQILVG
jgi:hypothetical protein